MSTLSRIIAAEIHKNGPVSAARFMELALYCPVYGYYERQPDSVGRSGDFQTSVSVGAMFGRLLATRFVSWLDRLKERRVDPLHLVEVGAHDGRLALDILGWMERQRPDLLENLHYHVLEPSGQRQEWQRTRLQGYADVVQWSSDFGELRGSTGGIRGVLFSNEMLDAMPCNRFEWDRGRKVWRESRVDEEKGAFVWRRGGLPDATSCAALDRIAPPGLHDVLPDGYVIDYSVAAGQWWREAADCIACGWVVALDYGFDSNSALLPERTQGTLRGYRQHKVTGEVLSDPGQQDITAHVHFGQLQGIGEDCGLNSEFFGSQERFLVQAMELATSAGDDAVVLDPEGVRQFKTLIHPDHFGHSFHVLVQSKL